MHGPLGIQPVERLAQAGFVVPDAGAHRAGRHRAVLKPPLREDRHVEPGDRLNAAPHDVALQ